MTGGAVATPSGTPDRTLFWAPIKRTAGPQQPSGQTVWPNVLILMADQFRSDALGAHGTSVCQTPHLDRLAAQGVTFSRAYTPTPLCTPARAALFTGRYPHSNGLTANTQYPECPTPFLNRGERMLSEHLAAAGYRCGYVGKWHLNVGDEAAEAHRRGIADFVSRPDAARRNRERLGLTARDDLGGGRRRTMEGDHPPMSGAAPYAEPYHQDAAVAGETVDLLRGYARDGIGRRDGRDGRPFALVCSITAPHFPIEVPEPFASLYDSASVPRFASFDDAFVGKPGGQTTHPWLQLGAHLSWPEWQRVIAHYWGLCTYVDALFGRVLSALEALGLAENTLVVATADHGEMAGRHRMFDKGPYFYEDVLRVPSVWRLPGTIAPRAVPDETLISHVDVVPTALDLLGVPPLPDAPPFQGHTLAGHLAGATPLERPCVFGETTASDLVNPQADARAIVTRTHKYVYRPGDLDELYDLEADPEELRNLSGTDARLESWLRQALERWMDDTLDTLEKPLSRR